MQEQIQEINGSLEFSPEVGFLKRIGWTAKKTGFFM